MNQSARLVDRPTDTRVAVLGSRLRNSASMLYRFLMRSPWPGRGLAVGAAFATYFSLSALLGLRAAEPALVAAGAASLAGFGGMFMTLPLCFGWPAKVLQSVIVVSLGLEALVESLRLLPGSSPAGLWLFLCFGLLFLLLKPGFMRNRPSLVGAIGAGVAGLFAILVGVKLIMLALGFVLSLGSSERLTMMEELGGGLALWFGIGLLVAIEDSRSLSLGRHLLSVRTLVLRIAAVGAGLSVGLIALNPAQHAANAHLFATPLERYAMPLGVCVAVLAGGLVVVALFMLPRLLARWQLGGYVCADAVSEASWTIGLLGLMGALAFLRYTASLADLYTLYVYVRYAGAWPMVCVAAGGAYALTRMALGAPCAGGSMPLWIFVCGAQASREALSCAGSLARRWRREGVGPVHVVADTRAALKVRGTHALQAQYANALDALFVRRDDEVIRWQQNRLPADAWQAQPVSELYGNEQAWKAALGCLEENACVLVLADRHPEYIVGWGTEFLQALPAERSEVLLGGAVLAVEPGSTLQWHHARYWNATAIGEWAPAFVARHQRAEQHTRRILLLHSRDDAPLAARIARALQGQVDAQGRMVAASTMAVQTVGPAMLSMSGRTWESVVALGGRRLMKVREGVGGWQRWSARLMRAVFPDDLARLDVLVLESPHWEAIRQRGAVVSEGLDTMADHLIALLPADTAEEFALLYPLERYMGGLVLPPQSAQNDAAMAKLTERLLSEDYIFSLSRSPKPAERAAPEVASMEVAE